MKKGIVKGKCSLFGLPLETMPRQVDNSAHRKQGFAFQSGRSQPSLSDEPVSNAKSRNGAIDSLNLL